MQLNSILDISANDPMVVDLHRLCSNFGLSDMSLVYLQVQKLSAFNGQQVTFMVSRDNCWEMVKTFLAVAAFSLAGIHHEKFDIAVYAFTPLGEKLEMSVVPITRIYPVETLEKNVYKFLDLALREMTIFDL